MLQGAAARVSEEALDHPLPDHRGEVPLRPKRARDDSMKSPRATGKQPCLRCSYSDECMRSAKRPARRVSAKIATGQSMAQLALERSAASHPAEMIVRRDRCGWNATGPAGEVLPAQIAHRDSCLAAVAA